MKSIWLGALKNEERENFKESVKNSKIVLDKLREIVYNTCKEKTVITFKDYDSPSWANKQAHANGYAEALNFVIELLDIDNNKVDHA